MRVARAAVDGGRRGRVLLRVALALGSTLLALALVEGSYSLVTGRSLASRMLAPAYERAARPVRPERAAVAAPTPGPYTRDPDPEVLLRVEPNSQHLFAGAPATTDAFGQRVTPRALGGAADRRVVLLGDSVAFGFGLTDEQTYAAQLERWLAQACASTGTRVAVSTLACPGWNARSAFRALRNHIGRLAPDLVLYVAVMNDLDDPKGVDTAGWHDLDFSNDPSRPACSDERQARLIQTLIGLPSRATLVEVMGRGGLRGLEHALRSGATPESQRRWDEHVHALGELQADLAARGVELAVVLPFDEDYYRQLELRVAAALPELRVFGLCSAPELSDSLGHDPHPNAECVRAGAWRIARWLLDQRFVPCDGAALDPIPHAYRERRYELVERGRRGAELERILELKRGLIWPRIDFLDVRGAHQVYGGLLGDGSMGRHASFVLARASGAHLALEFERLDAASGLYPLELVATSGGRTLGRIAVAPPESGADARARIEFDLPPPADGERWLEVLLSASNWVEADSAAGRRPVSIRIRSIEIAR